MSSPSSEPEPSESTSSNSMSSSRSPGVENIFMIYKNIFVIIKVIFVTNILNIARKGLPPTKSTVSLILTDSGNSPGKKQVKAWVKHFWDTRKKNREKLLILISTSDKDKYQLAFHRRTSGFALRQQSTWGSRQPWHPTQRMLFRVLIVVQLCFYWYLRILASYTKNVIGVLLVLLLLEDRCAFSSTQRKLLQSNVFELNSGSPDSHEGQ